MQVPQSAVVNIGLIPQGKKDLEVRLYAPSDVDVQLYDTENTTVFSEGTAIIGYCDQPGCNKGLLGNNDGTAESADYRGRRYSYSGYDGDGASKGNEYIRVAGVSNTALMMKAYGYQSGQALISYSYYEDYSMPGRPVEPSIDWMVSVNHRSPHRPLPGTHGYHNRTARGCAIPGQQPPRNCWPDKSVVIMGWRGMPTASRCAGAVGEPTQSIHEYVQHHMTGWGYRVRCVARRIRSLGRHRITVEVQV